MKLSLQYAIVIPDKYGQTVQLFDTEEHAKQYMEAIKLISKSKVDINIKSR